MKCVRTTCPRRLQPTRGAADGYFNSDTFWCRLVCSGCLSGEGDGEGEGPDVIDGPQLRFCVERTVSRILRRSAAAASTSDAGLQHQHHSHSFPTKSHDANSPNTVVVATSTVSGEVTSGDAEA